MEPTIRRPRPRRRPEPIAAIEKRVIDSSAYSVLSPSAVAVLVLLCRNLSKDRNGHIQLPAAQAAAHGVERKTLYRSLRELRSRGMVFCTSRGGYGQASKFALTWLPIKDRTGLHLDAFEPHAWRHDQPAARGRRILVPLVEEEAPCCSTP